MTNAPTLIVRHRRFTLLITILLAGMLAIAATGISIELYNAQAGVVFVLWPQVLTLLGACLVREAYDRWSMSAPCLTVSAEGLTLPGITLRPIPWTAVRSVRGVCCSPVPEHAQLPRHYMLFDVEAPESFTVRSRSAVRGLAAPLPADAPRITLDLSELDASKEAILAAVRHFHPAAVADAGAPATFANEASIRFPSLQELVVAAGRMHADMLALVARRSEAWPAVLAHWHRIEPGARAWTLARVAAATDARQLATTYARAWVQWLRGQALSLQDQAAIAMARGLEVVRGAVLDLRHRFDRSF